MFIENTTPYIGKIKYRLEKYPEYTGGNPWSKLNKIHKDLGFVKLVSRMYPNQKKDGLEINMEKVLRIESSTGGKIGKYEWWEAISKNTQNHRTMTKKPNPDIYKEQFHGELPNSFMTENGIYMGDIGQAWWYYQNQFRVSEKYPGRVAIQYDERTYNHQNLYISLSGKLPEDKIIGYYGYSHRGGSVFKLGDKIFDEKYKPIEEDYEEWQWAGYVKNYEDGLADAKKCKDNFDIKDIESDGISRYISFTQRGKKIIKTWEDAELAAYNLSNYLG